MTGALSNGMPLSDVTKDMIAEVMWNGTPKWSHEL
jgi:hypothetical protein